MGVNETKKATGDLFRLVQNLQTRLSAVRVFTDPDLTPQALEDTRTRMRDTSRQAATAKAAKLLNIAKAGAAFAQSKLDEVRPKVDLADVAQLARARDAWDMIVQPARDEGRSWFDIASTADYDTLMALDRFAEQRTRLQDPTDADIILTNLRAATDRRLGDIHPDPTAKQLFDDARTATDHVVLAQHLADSADSRNLSQVVGALTVAKSYSYGHGIELPKTPAPSLDELDSMSHLPQYADTTI